MAACVVVIPYCVTRKGTPQSPANDRMALDIAPGMVVSGYSPIRNEIDPAPLMRKLAGQGATLALPAVLSRGKSLAFRAWSPDDRLMLGPLGIPEPSPAAAEVHPDVMLVPLAAFDKLGHRIGYGAGYFSYKWAEVLSADAYAAFEEVGDPFDATVGQRFLDEILSRGGARPAIENFRAFRGRDPEVDALLRHSGMIS